MIKKIIIIFNLSLIRILKTLVFFFLLKSLLLHHINFADIYFLNLLSIDSLEKGRFIFICNFLICIIAIFILGKFILKIHKRKKIDKNLALISLFFEMAFYYLILTIFYKNYLIFIIITILILICINFITKKNITNSVSNPLGLVIFTIFTYSNKMFVDQIFEVIILFIFLRALLRNLNYIFKLNKDQKYLNLSNFIKI